MGDDSSYSIHKAKEVDLHKEGPYPGCKVTILQMNKVGSWSWPCGFVHCY